MARIGLPKPVGWARSALALVALATLCSSALAQENETGYWLERGEELLFNCSMEEAVEAFNKTIDIDPENVEAWRYKAIALRDLGEYDRAIEAFDEAIDLDPLNTRAKLEKAELLTVMGRRAEALSIFDEATAEVSEDPDERILQSRAWRGRGAIFFEQGQWNESLSAYDRAIELGSTDRDPLSLVAAWSNKGCVLYELGRYEEAIDACDTALEIFNDSFVRSFDLMSPTQTGGTWLWKGEALDALGRHDEALDAYGRAEERYEIDTTWLPEVAKFWKFKADALEGMGRHDEAALSYERAVDAFEEEIEAHSESSNVWRYRWMGEALEALGRQDDAEAAFDRAKEIGYKG
ncbi:MAG: tetratricopeptide repeat protein [Methanotrichaceae archaeon]|nr:tetratricopeptide repeat protein [Methanotrichaceae archaeon]